LVHEPGAGVEVLNPTHEVPPGQVLAELFPAHHDCVGAGAGQVPVGGVTLQLFCACAKTLASKSTDAKVKLFAARHDLLPVLYVPFFIVLSST
jgi:hypothetical protein